MKPQRGAISESFKPLDVCFYLYTACSFDFENGIDGWEKTGTAFNNQPTFGDNPTARIKGQPANQQGDWWIGGYEDRPSEAADAGKVQGDGPKGTLTSPRFRIVGQNISFLIGGGCDMTSVRAELIVDNKVTVISESIVFILFPKPK